MCKIITYIIPEIVSVRKFQVDTKSLCELLRKSKTSVGQTNFQISEQLNVPLTKVEHWFRNDKYFAIPDAEIWFELKELLNITTDDFDKSIMTFEKKFGVYEKSHRVYDPEGIAPTITSADADIKIIEVGEQYDFL
jgi:hypothetical protein